MIRITFRKPQNGEYWAICESLSQYDELNGYDLDNVLETSRGTGPASQVTTPSDWQIICIEEVQI